MPETATPLSIKIPEYRTVYIAKTDLPHAIGEWLWQTYDQHHQKLRVEVPSFRTKHKWALTAQGWVGIIPLPNGGEIWLTPKVPIHNLLGMLMYAYTLPWQKGLIEVDTLPDLLTALAEILGQLVLARAQKGLYRTYVRQKKQSTFIRGRIRPQPTLTPTITCQYDVFEADISENQVIRYTLACLVHGGWMQRGTTAVTRAYRLLQPITSHRAFTAHDCQTFSYTSLNQDYQPIHALCRFFLDHLTPAHQQGENTMLPFLIQMSLLYERFVAEWLKRHLPTGWRVHVQEKVQLQSIIHRVNLSIDLVLYNPNNEPVAVLDTKYKAPTTTSPSDLYQIATYANLKGVKTAVLIYPTPLAKPLDITIDTVRIISLPFTLDDDLQETGHRFLQILPITFK